jgi:hypothetical protein
MSKIGVGVGEEFPVDEPPAGEPREDETCRSHHDWHRERRARREEWRARKRAFKEEVRDSMRRHFGVNDMPHHHKFLRVLVGVSLIALAIAFLPLTFLFVAVALIAILFAAHRGGFHHYHASLPDHRHDGGA